MSMNHTKAHPIHSAKQSILLERMDNSQQAIEVGQSINIISMGLTSKTKKFKNSPESCPKRQPIDRPPNTNRRHTRTSNPNLKLNIKNNYFGITGDEQNKQITHMPVIQQLNSNDFTQKYTRKPFVLNDKNKINDMTRFQNTAPQILNRIEDLHQQNVQLNTKIKKYQNYFKQLKFKDHQHHQNLNQIVDINSQKNDKYAQLKILNLQRKVQTLKYIIKNYRNNNKEQLQQFYKKVNDYKPTIEQQLTAMLANANKKNEQVTSIIQYFQKQFQTQYKNGNWVEVVKSLKKKDQTIWTLQQQVTILKQEIKQLTQCSQQGKIYQQKYHQLTKSNNNLLQEHQQLNYYYIKLKQQKQTRQTQYSNLYQNYQQLTFKYQALVKLQAKIKQKDQLLKKNLQTINRIQGQNQLLQTKIRTFIKNQNTQLFDKQLGPIGTIQKCSCTVSELANRFCQQIQGLSNVSKQLTSFIIHLYDKTKTSFEKMVDEYRQQLQKLNLQNRQLQNRLNSFIELNKRKHIFSQQLTEKMNNIEEKRKRCYESQSRIQNKPQCSPCMSWNLHWGQINTLYLQLYEFVEKHRQIEE